MTKSNVSFIGALLKAIACTPNNNLDEADYAQRVLEPTRRIRKTGEDLAGAPPSEAQMHDLLAALKGILEAKQVDPKELQERMQEILEQFNISHSSHPMPPVRISNGAY